MEKRAEWVKPSRIQNEKSSTRTQKDRSSDVQYPSRKGVNLQPRICAGSYKLGNFDENHIIKERRLAGHLMRSKDPENLSYDDTELISEGGFDMYAIRHKSATFKKH
jgi:hypothetical protein